MPRRSEYLAFGQPNFGSGEIEAVTRVLNSGWVGMGPETIAFENELGGFLGARNVVTVNSCTSALFLALMVEEIGSGDEVIVPSLTWYATANAALYLGATPVFCDVDSATLCATPETISAKLSPRTKAVIVVHFGGYAVDVQTLRAALPAHVAIIEDAAHALGARHSDGTKVGGSGNLVCFSFYANKNLSTADGGAIALGDPDKAERLRSLRMNGLDSNAWTRYSKPTTVIKTGPSELGFKMNFTDLQAAIGRIQLKRQDEMAEVRRKVALRYRDRFLEHRLPFPFQSHVFDDGHARHLLVALFDPVVTGMRRDDILLSLRAENIGTSIHYSPLHRQTLYKPSLQPRLPVTERLADQIMTLPLSARMTPEDADYVVDCLVSVMPSTGTGK
jgi:dTDP-4-amino-4,6-dideoxygalactose transaminase